MKKILFVLVLAFAGCAATSPGINYRFADKPDLINFQIRTESLGGTKILLINGSPQDTIRGLSAFKTEDNRLSTWNGKTVEFSGKFYYYVYSSEIKVRVKVNNELVLDEMK